MFFFVLGMALTWWFLCICWLPTCNKIAKSMVFLPETQLPWCAHWPSLVGTLRHHPETSFKNETLGLPWWRSGWESACQCRGHGFEPWSGKIPQAAEQLGPWATTTEPARLEPVLCSKRGRDGERPAHRYEEWPLLAATRESPLTETKTQHSQKERKKETLI